MKYDKTKVDGNLGLEIQAHLESLGLQTPVVKERLYVDNKTKIDIIEHHMRIIWETLGMDMSDDSLCETPNRIAKMMVLEDYYGLLPENFPKKTTIRNKFNTKGAVTVEKIRVIGKCEHHGILIHGYAWVGYIPDKTVIGLSKLSRIVSYLSRRPQVQERLTEQIYHTLVKLLGTDSVAVYINAEHTCMTTRGIEDSDARTSTVRLGGAFDTDPSARSEFLSKVSV